MREDQSETIRNTLRFLAELRLNDLIGEEILAQIDRLIRGDVFIDSTVEVFLGQQQGELFSKDGQSHNGKHDGRSKDGTKKLKEPLRFRANLDRQTLYFFVMRMREAQKFEKIAAKKSDTFAAYGWSCRALAYDEVCAELKARGFGQK